MASRHLRIAIIGTGFSGIAMASRLLADGHRDVVLLERYDDTGGTWRDNTYPGAACDIPSHLYSLADAPNPDWSRHYAPQQEIRAYLDRVVAERGLRARTRFGFDVRSATWDELDCTWTLTSARDEQVVADVVVNAIGGLKDPKYPDIPGLDGFEGPVLHSARWDHDADLTGRVGMIGTGASAIQLAPELQRTATHLTVFQRTPAWVVPRRDRAFSAAQRAAFRVVPGLREAYRQRLYLEHELFRSAFTQGTPLNRAGHALALAHLHRQVRDPELRRALTPDYTFGCKRVLRSDDYYPALTSPNVRVATDRVAAVEGRDVVLATGERVELDALVLATGFTVDDPLGGTVVTGRDGRDLDRFWNGRPSAYLGTSVPGFPNMWMLMGPNAALGHNSVVLMAEAAVDHVAQACDLLRGDDVVSLEVAGFVHDDFVRWVDRQVGDSAWAGGCASWYLNDRGENFTVWPGTVGSYRRALATFELADHHVRRTSDAPLRREALV